MNRYPATGEYASETTINIKGIANENEKKILETKLKKQIDDSLQYSRERDTLLGFIPYYYKQYHNFDSTSISRTKDFFKAAYIANGYFRGGNTEFKFISDSGKRAKKIIIEAYPYLNHTIDTVVYKINDPNLQGLTKEVDTFKVVHKNDLYSQELLNLERTRLASHFRNNGYLYFTKDDIKVIADTINIYLFKIPKDPNEQQELLEKAIEFDKNPTTKITFTLQDTLLAKKTKKYYIGNVIVEPDNINEEMNPPNKEKIKELNIDKNYFVNKYKNSVFENVIFLKKDSLFRQIDYDKTLLALNYLGPWQQIIISIIEKPNGGDTVDFKINMLPFKHYLSNRKIEGSYNIGNATSTILSNLWGINLSQNITNKNFAKRAIQSTYSAYGSVEFGRSSDVTRKRLINTIQYGTNFNFVFPKSLIFNSLNGTKRNNNVKSFFNININQSNRLDFFDLFDLGLSFGYQGKRNTKRKKNVDFQFNFPFPVFEYKNLNTTANFEDILNNQPALRNIYRDGLIVSHKGVLNFIKQIKEKPTDKINNYKVIKVSGELAYFAGGKSFNFVKAEFDGRYHFINARRWIALRAFIGIGQPYNQSNSINKNLPFFRQFVGGGPYSMRAWAVRTLSSYSTRNTPNANQRINESFGDIQIEGNAEYRFTLGKIAGIPIRFAFFTDVGNIWNLRANNPALVPTNKSQLHRIYDDIAIAAGPSVRFDFNYFLLRFDIGAKIKDPQTIENTGGFIFNNKQNLALDALRLQIGVNYPF